MTSNSSGQIDLMHWLYRLIAFIIDWIIVGIVAYIIYFVAFVAAVLSGSAILIGTYFFLPLFWGILLVIYSAILDVYWGATIGKRIIGLQVQMVKGGKVTIEKAFIRNISKFYAYEILLFLDWVIAVVTPGPDRRQKITDRWAGTTVVQIKQPFQSSAPSAPSPPPPPPAPT